MPLPFSLSGSVKIDGQTDLAAAVGKLQRALEGLKAKNIACFDEPLGFVGGLFRVVDGTNILGPIGSGELTLKTSQAGLAVKYRLRFGQMFVVAGIAVGLFFGPMVIAAPNLANGEAAAVLLVMWPWFFGGNVAVALVRFPRWIRRTLEGDTV